MALIPRKRMSSDLLDPKPKEGSFNGVTSDGVFKATGEAIDKILDDGSTSEAIVVAVPSSQSSNYTVGNYYEVQGKVAKLRTKTEGDNVTQLTFDTTSGVLEAVNNLVEDIASIGSPLQWKGPATVAELNAGITGIQPGWTYTLTDSGTLTDGSVNVEVGEEVAWTEDDEWFKVGGDSSQIAVFKAIYDQEAQSFVYPSYADLNAARLAGKLPVIAQITPVGGYYYFVATQMSAYMNDVDFRFVNVETGGMLKLAGPTSNPVWSFTSAVGITNWGDRTESDIVGGVFTIGGGNSLTKLTLTSVQTLTVVANADIPNFALEIDNTGNSNNVTITVNNSIGTALNSSVAGGNTVEAGKYYQLTCVGNCWTLAEFTVPTP